MMDYLEEVGIVDGRCETCSARGVAFDCIGFWLCEECLFESAVADEYDLDEDEDYGDPD